MTTYPLQNSAATTRTPTFVRVFGSNGSGNIPVGPQVAAVGDLIVGAWRITDLSVKTSSFATSVTTLGEINQSSASDLSSQEFWIGIVPQS